MFHQYRKLKEKLQAEWNFHWKVSKLLLKENEKDINRLFHLSLFIQKKLRIKDAKIMMCQLKIDIYKPTILYNKCKCKELLTKACLSFLLQTSCIRQWRIMFPSRNK